MKKIMLWNGSSWQIACCFQFTKLHPLSLFSFIFIVCFVGLTLLCVPCIKFNDTYIVHFQRLHGKFMFLFCLLLCPLSRNPNTHPEQSMRIHLCIFLLKDSLEFRKQNMKASPSSLSSSHWQNERKFWQSNGNRWLMRTDQFANKWTAYAAFNPNSFSRWTLHGNNYMVFL